MPGLHLKYCRKLGKVLYFCPILVGNQKTVPFIPTQTFGNVKHTKNYPILFLDCNLLLLENIFLKVAKLTVSHVTTPFTDNDQHCRILNETLFLFIVTLMSGLGNQVSLLQRGFQLLVKSNFVIALHGFTLLRFVIG